MGSIYPTNPKNKATKEITKKALILPSWLKEVGKPARIIITQGSIAQKAYFISLVSTIF